MPTEPEGQKPKRAPTVHVDVDEASRIAEEAYKQGFNTKATRTESGIKLTYTPRKSGQVIGRAQIRSISWRGIHDEMRAPIESTIKTIYDEFDIEFIRSLEPKAYSRIMGFNPEAVASMQGNILHLNTLILGTEERWKKYRKEGDEAPETLENLIHRLTPEKQKIARYLLSFDRQTVDGQVEGIITHEIGHLIDHNHLRRDPRRQKVVKRREDYIRQLSARAADGPQEYIAESFVAYRKGEDIDPILSEMFDELRR